jgi:hypothetical protein
LIFEFYQFYPPLGTATEQSLGDLPLLGAAGTCLQSGQLDLLGIFLNLTQLPLLSGQERVHDVHVSSFSGLDT